MMIRITLPADGPEARANLARLIDERGEPFADLSRMIDRPPGYLREYVKKGRPQRLAEREARDLARYFRVEPQLFGVPLDVAPERPAGALLRQRDLDELDALALEAELAPYRT